jgi:hypothetical protein
MYLEIVSPLQSQKLKDLGFDYPCQLFYDADGYLRGYNTGISAPTQALALQWLRERFPQTAAGIIPIQGGYKRLFYTPRVVMGGSINSGANFTEYIMAEGSLIDLLLESCNG